MYLLLFSHPAAQKYPITLELHKDDPAETLNVHHLALAVQKVSSVPVSGQKLIYKGKIRYSTWREQFLVPFPLYHP